MLSKYYFVFLFSPIPRKYEKDHFCWLKLSICVYTWLLTVMNRRSLCSWVFLWFYKSTLDTIRIGRNNVPESFNPHLLYTPWQRRIFCLMPPSYQVNICCFLDLKWYWIKNAVQGLMALNVWLSSLFQGIFYFIWLS